MQWHGVVQGRRQVFQTGGAKLKYIRAQTAGDFGHAHFRTPCVGSLGGQPYNLFRVRRDNEKTN